MQNMGPQKTVKAGGKPLRVLVVDDSAVVRQSLCAIIGSDRGLEVMAAVGDPFAAVNRIRNETPDVIILDVEMPRMDGLTFLRKLMAQHPIPVVICSSLVGDHSETWSAAMAAGAVDVICKPQMDVKSFLDEQAGMICDVLKGAAQAKLNKLRHLEPTAKLNADVMLARAGPRAMIKTTETIIAIGASTGGTEALKVFLEALPPDSPPVVIVQHMPEHFTAAFARRIDSLSAITVTEARDNDRLLRGHALIAPGNKHLLLKRSGANYSVEVRDGPLVSRHRPSVDVLFRSVARYAGKNAVGIIMTGMGDDGARGLKEMREAGARTLGQDEASCVVYGMPCEAMRLGAVEQELPLDRLAGAALRICEH